MTAPTIVQIQDVSKRFVLHKHKSVKERIVNARSAREHREDFWALRDIDLDIPIGSTVGLVGHNGSGKSTLLKVIGGIIQPTTGSVKRRGRMAALLELGAGFHPDLTGRENVYMNAAILGLTQKQIDTYFDAIVDFSGIEEFIDTQVKFYSSGMYVRLAFAVAVHVDPDLLLVDEVLAVGDEPFQRKCMEKIEQFQREGRTIVVVSHSASQIGRLSDKVVVMDHGRMIFEGPPADGLRVLRFGYEEQERSQARLEGRPVTLNEDASILGISLQADGGTTEAATSGAPASLAFDYELRTAQSEPLVAGIAIETKQGEPLYGLNSGMLDLALPTSVGRHSVDFSFDSLPFGAGAYVIRGSLETAGGKSLDRLNPASEFAVADSLPGGGVVRMPVSARVRD
ncbi:ABC transporter ATP-binding protein [Agromyces protaetiae]|uniref:ABC transporter ATP-binding protein n=1 Tax=Agromyces protaetiae TaxID=2509455 RepID=A0A4P6FF55_9MICO|nr:ABC transporter ATP-binding protein [Agromyces protaetiae]QAY74584.1 ABC transporter ATP-binding protein [Agromyces protaetiae]